MTARIPFVDAHMHLWELKRLRYPWLTPPFSDEGPNGNVAPIASDYNVKDYTRDLAGWNVVAAVHVQAGAHEDDAEAESDWLQTLAAQEGLPSALVAFANLAGAGVEGVLERQAAKPLVRGIRHIANWHSDPGKTYAPADPLDNPDWCAGYGLLARYGLSFDFQLYPHQMSRAAGLAAVHENVPVIVNHVGMPVDRDDAGIARWREGMLQLADREHVSVKLSGFGIVERAWTAETIRPFILETIAMFGTKRCMIASDTPTDKLFSSIDRVMAAYEEILSPFSESERRDLFGRNAA